MSSFTSRIERLDNFPKLRRLKWILASNNAVSRIQDNLVNTLPNLKVLVLSNNRISVLSEIDKLKGLRYVAGKRGHIAIDCCASLTRYLVRNYSSRRLVARIGHSILHRSQQAA